MEDQALRRVPLSVAAWFRVQGLGSLGLRVYFFLRFRVWGHVPVGVVDVQLRALVILLRLKGLQ